MDEDYSRNKFSIQDSPLLSFLVKYYRKTHRVILWRVLRHLWLEGSSNAALETRVRRKNLFLLCEIESRNIWCTNRHVHRRRFVTTRATNSCDTNDRHVEKKKNKQNKNPRKLAAQVHWPSSILLPLPSSLFKFLDVYIFFFHYREREKTR